MNKVFDFFIFNTIYLPVLLLIRQGLCNGHPNAFSKVISELVAKHNILINTKNAQQ